MLGIVGLLSTPIADEYGVCLRLPTHENPTVKPRGVEEQARFNIWTSYYDE